MTEPDILSVARAALEHPHGAKKIYFADIRRLAQAVIDLSAELREVREWYAESIEARKK